MKDKKSVVNETFPEVDQVKKNAKMMVRSSLPMRRVMLVPMEIPMISWMCVSIKSKVLCLRVRLRIAIYTSRWKVFR